MSVTTKIVSPGLARDSAPEVGSQANALRRAENVVCRSPGVVESRPSFELLLESTTLERVRAIREFNGSIVMVTEHSGTHVWHIRDEGPAAYTLPVSGAAEPPDYHASETQFAQARENLYLAGKYGSVVLESETAGLGRMAGVDICVLTDYRYIGGNYSIAPAAVHSFAYEFVFVRKDSHGYTRRSPPSFRLVCVAGESQPNPNDVGVFGSGSIFYVPTTGVGALRAGDQVEFYRTRTAVGTAPQSACFLALTYTLTDDDIAQEFFVPPTDITFDDQLGSALYTNIDQEGALGAKYMPPVASTLASWARAMWFGRTVSKNRASFEILHLWRAGVARLARSATYTIASTLVTVADTSDLAPGMTWTDSFALGPTQDGTYVPANSYITDIVGPTTFNIFNAALASGTALSGVMGPQAYSGVQGAQQGLIAESAGSCTYASGSSTVFVPGGTSGYAAGMYWTDSASGPNTLGSHVLSHTTIDEVIDSSHIAMSTNAINSGSAVSYVGDTITIDGRDYYAWIAETDANHLSRDYWVWTSSKPYCFALLPPERGDLCFQHAIASLTQWINWHRLFGLAGAPGSTVAAIPTGPIDSPSTNVTESGDHDEIGQVEIDGGAHGVLLEEQGVGAAGWTVYSSCPSAFRAMPPSVLNSENDDRPNRLFWSDPDEPESVRVLSFVDIGLQTAPILRLAPLRNALMVFKADGVWRVTGSGPSSWSVELLDPTLNLLRPEALCVSQNKCYAWCVGGFYEFDENGSRSLTAGKLDVELREAAALVTASSFRGSLVVGVQQRNLVLFGAPGLSGGSDATTTVYAYNQTTGGWTEWPFEWGHACESKSLDRCYYSRPDEPAKTDNNAIDIEIRRMTADYRGYDRTYDLGPATLISGDVVTCTLADIGTWQPKAGDWISALSGSTRIYRRILTAAFGIGLWVLQLEDPIEDGTSLLVTDAGVFFVTEASAFFLISDLSGWQAHEGATFVLEWHPTAPSGLPVGAIARELQVQLDLREAPDPSAELSIPRYLVGGSTERNATVYTVESAMPRVATVQPLRVGVSRQVARGATVAPYFETSDIYAIRVVGASIVFEGVSEKTRR